MKAAADLSPSDFIESRVWEFIHSSEAELPDETYMRPVKQLPVASLSGRLVGATLTLANGTTVLGILGNIDVVDPLTTEHFLTVTVFRNSAERFDLARYHDIDYSRRDAAALAAFLGLPVNSVFPIRYDITDVALGRHDCLRRSVPETPATRLSQEDLLVLALRHAMG